VSFQTQILAMAIRNPYFLPLYGDIFKTSIFDTQYHKDICSWVNEFYAKYKTLPSRKSMSRILKNKVPFSNPLRQGYKSLLTRVFEMDISDADFVRDQLIQAVKFQNVKSALMMMTSQLDRAEFDLLVPTLDKALKVGQGVGDLGLELKRDMEPTVLRFGVLEHPISSGFKEFERVIGGFYSGEETVIVSPPNRGKTTMLGNLAYGMARQGATVMYYTLEIGAERMLCRFYANMAKVETKNLQDELPKIRGAIKRFRVSTAGTVYVKFFPARAASVDTIRNHISMARGMDVVPDAVIIDYAQLLRPSAESMRQRMRGDEILRMTYEDLRALANEFTLHIITGSQSKRNTLYADIIDLDDIGESWGIAQTADTIAAMCQSWEEKESKVLRLYIAKARNETSGKFVNCRADFSHLNIKEISIEAYVKEMRDHGYPVANDGRFTTGRRERRAARATAEEDSELEGHYQE
ncbi:hypothetical protein LCGC14_2384410, partial [marine sediment metagenome]